MCIVLSKLTTLVAYTTWTLTPAINWNVANRFATETAANTMLYMYYICSGSSRHRSHNTGLDSSVQDMRFTLPAQILHYLLLLLLSLSLRIFARLLKNLNRRKFAATRLWNLIAERVSISTVRIPHVLTISRLTHTRTHMQYATVLAHVKSSHILRLPVCPYPIAAGAPPCPVLLQSLLT